MLTCIPRPIECDQISNKSQMQAQNDKLCRMSVVHTQLDDILITLGRELCVSCREFLGGSARAHVSELL